jgi:glycerate kinase
VRRVVAAPDKFRGTASARSIADAVSRAGRAVGWATTEVPMSDGGEGLLDAVGGEPRLTTVTGPLGERVRAEWRLIPRDAPDGPIAVIEMARAAGLDLVARGDDRPVTSTPDAPLLASTVGVGQLIVAAREAGARRIVVGCGGSATTDGGWGALSALGPPEAFADVDLVAAADVRTGFVEAARMFAAQKGADPSQIRVLTDRLEDLADHYRDVLGVDVRALEGAGAAGGLAGGLAAFGARIVPGFDLVADMVDLSGALDGADVVMTGEGRLDAGSFAGKVVGGVLERVGGRCPVLCIVGSVDSHLGVRVDGAVDLVVLEELAGPTGARRQTLELVENTVRAYLARFRSPGEDG